MIWNDATFALMGILFGSLLASVWWRSDRRRMAARERELTLRCERLQSELSQNLEKCARLDERACQLERTVNDQREQFHQTLSQIDQKLRDDFRQISAGIVGEQTRNFLGLAERTFAAELERRELRLGQVVRPLQEWLGRFDAKLEGLEKMRTEEEATLREQLRALAEVHLPRLEQQTGHLARALSQPGARGRWGELQLRRVVELAGLVEHVDFDLQVDHTQEDGQRSRPDAVIHLPGGRTIVVDAKTPIDAYQRAVAATDDEARTQLFQHAKQLRAHIDRLASRSYPDIVTGSPDFTVLFLPGEMMFRAALEVDPDLLDYAIERKVLLATPLTLVALLKSVAYGWRQERTARNLSEVLVQVRELRTRLGKFLEHWTLLGTRLDQAIRAYNDAIGSFQRRVLVTLRRFDELAGTATPGDDALEPPQTLADRALTPSLPSTSDDDTERGA